MIPGTDPQVGTPSRDEMLLREDVCVGLLKCQGSYHTPPRQTLCPQIHMSAGKYLGNGGLGRGLANSDFAGCECRRVGDGRRVHLPRAPPPPGTCVGLSSPASCRDEEMRTIVAGQAPMQKKQAQHTTKRLEWGGIARHKSRARCHTSGESGSVTLPEPFIRE